MFPLIPPRFLPRRDRFLVAALHPELLDAYDAASNLDRQMITDLSVMSSVGGMSGDMLGDLPTNDVMLIVSASSPILRILASVPEHELVRKITKLIEAGESCAVATERVLTSAFPKIRDGGWMPDQTTFVLGKSE